MLCSDYILFTDYRVVPTHALGQPKEMFCLPSHACIIMVILTHLPICVLVLLVKVALALGGLSVFFQIPSKEVCLGSNLARSM